MMKLSTAREQNETQVFITVCYDGGHDGQNDTRMIREAMRQCGKGLRRVGTGDKYTMKAGEERGTDQGQDEGGQNIQNKESRECDIENGLTWAIMSGAGMPGGQGRYGRVKWWEGEGRLGEVSDGRGRYWDGHPSARRVLVGRPRTIQCTNAGDSVSGQVVRRPGG